MINRIQLHVTENTNAQNVLKTVLRFSVGNFEIVEEDPDLVIAIGGDGTFLHALQENHFNRKPLYVGIHTGHLGFLQEVDVENIEEFFQSLIRDDIQTQQLNLASIKVKTNRGIIESYALQELVVRESNLKVIHLDVRIDGHCLEKFSGDGIMVSTPTGSSAYNLSLGGSIVYPGLNLLQITPLAPLNSKAYRSLTNSVIVPECMEISLIPEQIHSEDILLTIDGVNKYIHDKVENIQVTTAKEKLSVIRFGQYDFWTRINDKFLT